MKISLISMTIIWMLIASVIRTEIIPKQNSIDNHHDSNRHRSDIIMDKQPIVESDDTDAEDDGGDDDEESISSHIITIFFELELLRSKIMAEFSNVNHQNNKIKNYEDYGEIFKKITKPLHGLITIYIKLQYELSRQCNNALIEWFNALLDQQLWSFRMVDSNGLIPQSGLLSGPISNFGSYDQCLAIDSGNEIRGQYCMIETRLLPQSSSMIKQSKPLKNDGKNPGKNDTIWMEIERKWRLLPAARWYLSVCLPSKCTREDVQQLIDDRRKFAEVKNCHHSGDVDGGTIIKQSSIFIIISMIIILAIIIVDRRYVRSNNLKKYDDRILSIIDAIRMINIILIIYWHTYIFTWKSSIRLSVKLFDLFHQLSPVQLMLIGWPLMESMLFLEALRLSYRMFHREKNSKQKNFQKISKEFSLHFFRRWSNLSLLLLVWMFTIIPYYGDGPQSFLSINQMNGCRQEWWRILLFAMNLNPQNSRCLPHLWIFTVEFQLFLLILPFIYIVQRMKLSRKTVITIVLITVITACSVTTTYYYHYDYNIKQLIEGIMISEMDFIDNLFLMNISPLFHLCSYLFGLLFGYWLSSSQQATGDGRLKFRLQTKTKTILAIILITTVSMELFLISFQQLHQSQSISSIILGTYRLIWSIWLMILLIFLFDFHTNPIRWITSPVSAFQTYLIHYLVIIVRDVQRRQSIVFNHWNMWEEFLVNLFLSLSLSFLIQFCISRPFGRIFQFCWHKISIRKISAVKCQSKLSIRSSLYQEVTNIDDDKQMVSDESNGNRIIPTDLSNNNKCTTVELTTLLSSSSSNGKD